MTQGCLAMHVAKGPGPVYMGNLALKINVKVRGSATRLNKARRMLVFYVILIWKARSNRVVPAFTLLHLSSLQTINGKHANHCNRNVPIIVVSVSLQCTSLQRAPVALHVI